MVDLHSHTTESDGTLTPAELVQAAAAARLEALAITDHDTFAGYDTAVPLARSVGLELICGIELSVKWQGHSVHLLGYFLNGEAPEGFRRWVTTMLENRKDRNQRLTESLRAHGVEITLEEVQQKAGPLTARPHFAAVLIEKGYAANPQQAFDLYLGEDAPCYVPRDEPQFAEAVRRVRENGGVSSVAHPGRTWARREAAAEHIREMRSCGLQAIEVWHSDHSPEDMNFFEQLAASNDLAATGGSDFHGAAKPSIHLGTGRDGRLGVPYDVLNRLRKLN